MDKLNAVLDKQMKGCGRKTEFISTNGKIILCGYGKVEDNDVYCEDCTRTRDKFDSLKAEILQAVIDDLKKEEEKMPVERTEYGDGAFVQIKVIRVNLEAAMGRISG